MEAGAKQGSYEGWGEDSQVPAQPELGFIVSQCNRDGHHREGIHETLRHPTGVSGRTNAYYCDIK